MSVISKGFVPKKNTSDRLPPGQFETTEFPVLSLGPTPKVHLDDWRFKVWGEADEKTWTWEEFGQLPREEIVWDIHCVTKWSKFDTKWTGVPMEEIMKAVNVRPETKYVIAHSYDGYTTNLPIGDVSNARAWIAVAYEGMPIMPEHGGPARWLVPHLYFWKSAKWIKGLEFSKEDRPGFWETRGYHNYGDPWKEQRYTYD